MRALFFALLLLSLAVFSALGAPIPEDVKKGEKLVESLQKAIERKDKKLIGEVFDDGFVFEACEKKYTKDDVIQLLDNLGFKMTSAIERSTQILLVGSKKFVATIRESFVPITAEFTSPNNRDMKLLPIFLLFTFSALCSSQERLNTKDVVPHAPVVRDAAKDAADIELARTTATKFAADLMNVRKSENIHDLTNWLADDIRFQMCGIELYFGHFLAFVTSALLEKEKYPTPLQLVVDNAYTRPEDPVNATVPRVPDAYLSMLVNASGFNFEANDQMILDFKKQPDGSYKMWHGDILTCRIVPAKDE
ncbi:unnamed protein product [Caenorhabditis sp. 36 PRJEB53466]|nr:unnamed protein product [Caenorhabditis sp. 36 PRJEB53466]